MGYLWLLEWKQYLKEAIVGITLFVSMVVLTTPADYADWVFIILFWFSFVWSVKYIVRFEIKDDRESKRNSNKAE